MDNGKTLPGRLRTWARFNFALDAKDDLRAAADRIDALERDNLAVKALYDNVLGQLEARERELAALRCAEGEEFGK